MTTEAEPVVRPPPMDITQASDTPSPTLPFAAFVARHLKRMTNAMALILDQETGAHDAVSSALTEIRQDWDETVGVEPARRRLFTRALRLALDTSTVADSANTAGTALDENDRGDGYARADPAIIMRACLVARYGLGWSRVVTAELLDLTVQQVDDLEFDARTQAVFPLEATDAPVDEFPEQFDDLSERTRLALKGTRAPLPDAAAISNAFERAERYRLWRIGVAVAAILAIVVAAGTFLIDGPDVAAPPLSDRSDRVVAEIIQSPAGVRDLGLGQARLLPVRKSVLPEGVSLTWETPMEPDLVIADGDGGFLGAVLGTEDGDAATTFVASPNGLRWTETDPTKLPIDRMERSEEGFVAWARAYGSQTAGQADGGAALILTRGDTGEPGQSTVSEFVIEDDPGLGFRADYQLLDATRNGEHLLVVVQTDPAVAEPASSSETGAGEGSLPARFRLFVGSANGSLQPVDVASLDLSFDSAPGVDTIDDRFVVTGSSALPVASSVDGVDWAKVAIPIPTSVNIAAAGWDPDQQMLVGVGEGSGGRLMLFRHGGDATNVEWSMLRSIVGQPIELRDVAIEQNDDGWVVLVVDRSDQGWLATSPDGRGWSAEPVGSVGEQPRVVVGDRAILVHSIADDATASIHVVPMD